MQPLHLFWLSPHVASVTSGAPLALPISWRRPSRMLVFQRTKLAMRSSRGTGSCCLLTIELGRNDHQRPATDADIPQCRKDQPRTSRRTTRLQNFEKRFATDADVPEWWENYGKIHKSDLNEIRERGSSNCSDAKLIYSPSRKCRTYLLTTFWGPEVVKLA